MFVFALLCISLCPFLFAIILKRKRGLVGLLLLSYCKCSVAVCKLVFTDHTHLLFGSLFKLAIMT